MSAAGGLPPLAAAVPGRSLAQTAALLAALPEPALLVGDDKRIRLANPAASELLGAGLEGQGALLVIRQPEPVAALERALVGAPGERQEARYLLTSAAAETLYRMVVHRLPEAHGLGGVLVSFLDISHVEEAEQMRRDFVANVSHELRSPLTVLSGFIETLQGPARDDPAARERFLGIMAQEARRMNRLVADLLSLSRLEANERVRPRERVVLAEVLRTTLAALRPLIEESGIRLEYDDATADAGLLGDRDQLVQVFHNLIENAIKYGGAGGRVTITLRSHPRWPGIVGPALSVVVTDEGEGIDPIHLPRLTERFYRVDSHRSRQMGGTGLGLAIVKHIVNRHRGRLSIDSERGRGSSFMVILPQA
jgi:two-component system phosphate regulon sensor histidine kinase PhoR